MSAIQNDMVGLTESHYKVLKRLKVVTEENRILIKKIENLGGSPIQLEMDL